MNIIRCPWLSLTICVGLAPVAAAQGADESSMTLPEVSVSAEAFFAPDTASQGVVTGKQIEEQPSARGRAGTDRHAAQWRGQGQPVFPAWLQSRSRHRYRHHAR